MYQKISVLIIEDEKSICDFIGKTLDSHEYKVTVANNGKDGLALITSSLPDLVLLDLGLPDMDGMTFLEDVRKDSLTPIIVLSARTNEKDKVLALDAGANDYVTKPFSVPELMARVKTNMRRAPLFEEKEKLIVFEDITMDLTERKVRRGDNYLHLSPTEFRLLKMLLKEPGKVFSREVLLKSVWGENIYVESRTVDVHIRRLRKTLNKYGPDYIRTVRANGYSIDKNISSQDDETILHNDMENKQ